MPPLRFVLKHQDRSRAFELAEGQEALVGRSIEAQFFLCAPSVSRRHCVLRSTSRGLELEDVSTRKDCYVNGRRVVAPVLLEDGCVLQLGGLTFSVGFPAPVAASCSRIEGDYQGDELVEFLQLIDFHQKTGTLEVRAGPISGQLRFHRGALADADTAGKTGVAAVRRLLAHRQGRFVFTPRDVNDVPSGLQLKVGAMLLDLARKIDESGEDWSALAKE